MKRFLFFLMVIALAAAVYGQDQLPEHRFATGSWSIRGERLYQDDARAPLAKVNIRSDQSGPMIWEFNARYESGAEDGHGGFGLHVFGDSAFSGAAWGAGQSWLLWLNYDENPLNRNIQRGLSGQVYRSYSNSQMDLVASYDLNQYAQYLTDENLADPVPFRITINGDTGEVRVYDPTDLSGFFSLQLSGRLPTRGSWAALRTNGMRMSFGDGL
ncbi:MAG: hypothetical protein LBI90_09705 [Treponema sp.]|jgi:hypothetical protein|nr:hypothetical protein [Treponema sp.]